MSSKLSMSTGSATASSNNPLSPTSPHPAAQLSPGSSASAALASFYDLPPHTADAAQSPIPSPSSTASSASAASFTPLTSPAASSPAPQPTSPRTPDSQIATTTNTAAATTSPTSQVGPTSPSPATPASPPPPSLSAEQQQVKDVMARFAEWHTDLSKNPNRLLIKEGRLARQAKFKSVDRLVYLFNDAFLVTDEVAKGAEAGRLIQKQLLDLRAIVVEDPVEKAATSGKKVSGVNALSFSILTPQRDFTFIAPNATVKAEWMRLIRDTATQHKLTNAGSIVEEGAVQGKVFGLAGDEGTEGRLLTATLHSAVSDGNDDIVLHLLSERNEDPNQKSPEGKTPVHLAIEHENAFALSLLIAHGADLSLVDGDGNAPLHIACQHCDFGTVMVLLSKGADVLAVDGDGKTPLWLLCENVHDTTETEMGAEDASTKAVVDMVRMFVDAGASVDEEWQGQSLLFHLCTKGKWQSVAALCANSVNVSQVDSLGRTPLHLVALLSTVATAAPLLTSYLRIARLLLSHGAAPNCRDASFNSPLHLTTSQGLAGCLLVNGARADLKNQQQKKATEWFEAKAHFASEADWLQAKDSLRDAQTAWVERSETVLEEGGELSDDKQWLADDAIPQCVLCALEFTLTRRRHHCRRCGSCIEAQCCSKTFRCISTQPGKMGQEVSERCCDCCYNIMCEKAVEEGKRRREEKRKEAEKARQQAAAAAAAKERDAASGKDSDDSARRVRESEERVKAITERTATKQAAFEEKKQADKERARAELKGELKATMTGNRSMLEERGQKLNEMSDKSGELMDQAANFAEMAKKLKEKEKGKASWFGF